MTFKLARNFRHIKKGWREIGGKRTYFRSMLELNYAQRLETLKITGNIKDWAHEPKVFYFLKIKIGIRSYTPDFKVFENDGSHYYVECKGYMDNKSRTKINRFRKYYPQEKLKLYPERMEIELTRKKVKNVKIESA